MTDSIIVINNDAFNLVTEGIQGPPGIQGAQGDGILLLGAVANAGDLPSSSNTAGDAWMVGTHLYVWSGSAWTDTGDIKGATGESGPGMPTGGSASQVLLKTGTADYASAWATLDPTYVQLGSVDNTSDANKPVSTAQQTALNLKANLASPTFTGTVGGITAAMVGAESALGNPASDGMMLISTTAGVRSWGSAPVSTGSTLYLHANCGGF